MTPQQKKAAQSLLQEIEKYAEKAVQKTPFGIFVELDVRGKCPALAIRVLEQPKIKIPKTKKKGSK